jgi:DNA-binding CsgD family transcriptional regulator
MRQKTRLKSKQVIKLYLTGKTKKEISEAVNLSMYTITSILKNAGFIKEKRGEFKRNREIVLMYRNGHTQEDIGKHFGITKVRVGQLLKRSGIRKKDEKIKILRIKEEIFNLIKKDKYLTKPTMDKIGELKGSLLYHHTFGIMTHVKEQRNKVVSELYKTKSAKEIVNMGIWGVTRVNRVYQICDDKKLAKTNNIIKTINGLKGSRREITNELNNKGIKTTFGKPFTISNLQHYTNK